MIDSVPVKAGEAGLIVTVTVPTTPFATPAVYVVGESVIDAIVCAPDCTVGEIDCGELLMPVWV